MLANRWILSGLMLLIPHGLTQVAEAGHGMLEQDARRMERDARRVERGVDLIFRDSVFYRAMQIESCALVDLSADVHQLIHGNAPLGRLRGKLIVAEAKVRHLQTLVDLAERRARRGFDPPLCGCADDVRHLLRDLQCTVGDLQQQVVALERQLRRPAICPPSRGSHFDHDLHRQRYDRADLRFLSPGGSRGGTRFELRLDL